MAPAFDRVLNAAPTPLLLLTSVLCSAAIVRANRAVFDSAIVGPWTLAAIHYIFLGAVLGALQACGQCTPSSAPIPFMTRLAMAGVALLANVASNFSLKTNTIPTYQLFKLLVIPAQVAIYNRVFGQRYATSTLFALLLIMCGVYLATGSTFDGNPTGLAVGLTSIVIVSIDTVGNGEAKRIYGLSSFQFNAATTWLRAVLCIALAVALEFKNTLAVIDTDLFANNPHFLKSLLLSCVAAVGVNIVAVAIIGRVSAVGYSVLGHCKTLLILVSGGLSFLDTTKVIGIFLALIGSALYAEKNRKKRKHSNSNSNSNMNMTMNLKTE